MVDMEKFEIGQKLVLRSGEVVEYIENDRRWKDRYIIMRPRNITGNRFRNGCFHANQKCDLDVVGVYEELRQGDSVTKINVEVKMKSHNDILSVIQENDMRFNNKGEVLWNGKVVFIPQYWGLCGEEIDLDKNDINQIFID